MTVAPGDLLQQRYRVGSLLGQGGMGAVFRGYDTRLDVSVAVKEMTVQPGLDAEMLHDLRGQFEQEAKTLARLRHPGLVRVSDFFIEDPNAYLVMDFVEGESLADRIQRDGALSEAQVVLWMGELLDALAYCHDQSVLHRDVKPHNVIIASDGRAILVDFGLVKLWDPANPVTQTVVRGMGTLEYAPPEQYSLRSAHTDPRSDLYSLGSTMYHALTGQAPPTATDRMADPANFLPVRRLNPEVSANTEAVILKAMELARDARFPDARTMLEALGSGAEPKPELAPEAVPEPVPERVPEPTELLPEPLETLPERADEPHPEPEGAEHPGEPLPATVRADVERGPGEGKEGEAPPPGKTVVEPPASEQPVSEQPASEQPGPVSLTPVETARARARLPRADQQGKGRRRKGWLWALGVLIVLIAGGAGTLWALGYLDNLALFAPAATPLPGPANEEPRSAAPVENVPPPAGVWVVATTPDLPPMAFEGPQGDLAGYDIDLMRLVGEHAGFEVEFVPVPRDALFPGLEAGEFDAVIAAVTITEDRRQRFLFSEPYLNAGCVIVAPMDSDVRDTPGLRGRPVGVQGDTPCMAALERIGEVDIRAFDDPQAAFIALNERAVDAVVCDLVTASRRVRAPEDAGPPVRIVGDPLTEELYGIVLPLGHVEPLDRVNVALDAIRREGLDRELSDAWLR